MTAAWSSQENDVSVQNEHKDTLCKIDDINKNVSRTQIIIIIFRIDYTIRVVYSNYNNKFKQNV